MGIFLTLVAIEIIFVLLPFALTWGTVRSFSRPAKEFDRRTTNIAIALDILAKHLFASLLDDLLIKDNSLSFTRNISSTISEDLGVFDQLLGLSNKGLWLVQRLHYLDPWHVEKAIGMNVPKVKFTFWQQASRFAVTLLLFAIFSCILAGFSLILYYVINQTINLL